MRRHYVMRDLHDRDVFHVYSYTEFISPVYGKETVKWLLFSLPEECLGEVLTHEQNGEMRKLDCGESVECEISLEIKRGSRIRTGER